jgi:hypothetical protein
LIQICYPFFSSARVPDPLIEILRESVSEGSSKGFQERLSKSLPKRIQSIRRPATPVRPFRPNPKIAGSFRRQSVPATPDQPEGATICPFPHHAEIIHGKDWEK